MTDPTARQGDTAAAETENGQGAPETAPKSGLMAQLFGKLK